MTGEFHIEKYGIQVTALRPQGSLHPALRSVKTKAEGQVCISPEQQLLAAERQKQAGQREVMLCLVCSCLLSCCSCCWRLRHRHVSGNPTAKSNEMLQGSNCCRYTCSRVQRPVLTCYSLNPAYLDNRGDKPAVRHCHGNGNINVLIVCDALAISRARCKPHKGPVDLTLIAGLTALELSALSGHHQHALQSRPDHYAT